MLYSDKHQPQLAAWLLATVCASSGTILYILTGGQNSGWANVLWGSFYGLGFSVLSLFLSAQSGVGGLMFFIIGGFVWPIIATVLIAYAVEFLLRSWNPMLVIWITLVTNLLIYPMARAPGTIVYYLPIYGVFLENF